MSWAKTFTMLSICFFGSCMVDGCGNETHNDAGLSSDVLGAEAFGTHACYVKMRKAGETQASNEIPRSCWTEGIRALRPLRVYLHRVNVVVVQKVSDGVEEGKYINIVISSYLPQNGDDGFTFTHQEGCVYDFKRTLPQSPNQLPTPP